MPTAERPAPVLSVVLCTWNRAASLDRTLVGLRTCRPPRTGAWELLLVDNGSTDSTPEVAAAHADALPLRRVVETERGLSAARNRGLAEARGEVVLFTDDDVDVDGGWLCAFEEAARIHPDAGWFGGRILPRFDAGAPRWLRDPSMAGLAGMLGHYDLGPDVRPYAPDEATPFGACFALRRATARTVGTFRTDLGVVGGEPGRGEETDYLARARALHIDGVYVGSALVHHRIPADRFRLRALLEWGRHVGRSQARRGYRREGTRRAEFGFVLRGVLQWLRGRGDRFRQSLINAGIQRGRREAWSHAARGPAGDA